ncbi:MAG: hypothetical protein GY940_28170 [bacterium]|nr:hypothetical protein [bacterium]
MDTTWLKDSELKKFILHHARLAPGDKLEGKVIDVRTNGRVLIDFGRFRAFAETQIPVKSGEVINVVVEARSPKLKLRLESARTAGKVAPDAREAIKNLAVEPQNQWDKTHLVLQNLLDYDDIAGTLFPPSLKEALETGEQPVKLKIHPPEPGKEDEPINLSMLMDTPQLDKIRVDFLFKAKQSKLSITFFVKNNEIKSYIEANLPKAGKNLEHRFRKLVLHVIVSEKSIAEFDAEELESKIGSRQVLDVNA